jgi:hypothetical protein
LERRRLLYAGLFGLIVVLCWFIPLFHIRRLGGLPAIDERANITETKTSPSTRSRDLDEYLAKAIPITKIWDAFDSDFTKAKVQFGEQAGLGGGTFLCIRGAGKIASIRKDHAVVTMDGNQRQVWLELGVVVDNTVRDALGVKAAEFNNAQEFNAFSSALNRQVELDVIEPNRSLLKEGVQVSFVGCAKIATKTDLDSLKIVPIQLQVNP